MKKQRTQLTEQQKADGNFYIVKASFHIRNAQFYFEEVRESLGDSMKSETKVWFREMTNRMKFLWVEMYKRLSAKSKEHLAKELEDVRTFDSITNTVMALPQEYRDRLEDEANRLYAEYKKDPKYKERLETFNNEEAKE